MLRIVLNESITNCLSIHGIVEPLRSAYARGKVAGVPFEDLGRYEYLWRFERFALHGPKSFGDSMYYDSIRRTVEFCRIKDELCPGWREKEAEKERRWSAKQEAMDRQFAARERRELEKTRAAWLASGGAP